MAPISTRPQGFNAGVASIIPHAGPIFQVRNRLRTFLNSLNARSRVHPTNFQHSLNSHFSPYVSSSQSPVQPHIEKDPTNTPRSLVSNNEIVLHGIPMLSTLSP